MSPPWGPANTEKIAKITMSQCQQSLHLCKLCSTVRWKIASELFWRLGVATVEKDGRWRYHYMVSAWFIFLEHIINVKIQRPSNINRKLRPQISCQHGNVTDVGSSVRLAWDSDPRERKEIPWYHGLHWSPGSLNCCPWHDRTLPNVLRRWDPAWWRSRLLYILHILQFTARQGMWSVTVPPN